MVPIQDQHSSIKRYTLNTSYLRIMLPIGIEEIATILPLQLTSFVGREPEIEQLKEFLLSSGAGSARLVTLLGEGATGKTL